MDGLFLNGDADYHSDKHENLDALSIPATQPDEPTDPSDPLVPHSGGRRPALERNEFYEDEQGQLLCKHCKASVSPKVERLRLHLQNCPSYNGVKQETSDSAPAKKKLRKSRKDSDSSTTNSEQDNSDEDYEDEGEVVNVKKEDVNADIDEAIARFFYEANVPPIKAENMYFRSMIYKLRPNYSAPDRYQLEQRLLKFRQNKK